MAEKYSEGVLWDRSLRKCFGIDFKEQLKKETLKG